MSHPQSSGPPPDPNAEQSGRPQFEARQPWVSPDRSYLAWAPHSWASQPWGGGGTPGSCCPNGHVVGLSAAFCPRCGTAMHRSPLFSSPFAVTPRSVADEAERGQANEARARSAATFRKLIAPTLLLVTALVASWIWAQQPQVSYVTRVADRVPPSTVTVTGHLTLTDEETAGDLCRGSGGYSDIGAGVTVALTNEVSLLLGSSVLRAGVADPALNTCTYAFSIPGVSVEQDHYAVEVSDRGKVTSSRTEMVENGWDVGLAMGH